MSDHFIDSQHRGASLPQSVLGMQPVIRPTNNMLSTVGNDYANHQQIVSSQVWNMQPPTRDVDMNKTNSNQISNQTNSVITNDNDIVNDEKRDEVTIANGNGNEVKQKSSEVVLPKALEAVLALKDQRAAQFDTHSEDISIMNVKDNNEIPIVVSHVSINNTTVAGGVISNDYEDAGEYSDDDKNEINGIMTTEKNARQSKADKNKRKKRRKKLNKKIKKQKDQSLNRQSGHLNDNGILKDCSNETDAEIELNTQKNTDTSMSTKTLMEETRYIVKSTINTDKNKNDRSKSFNGSKSVQSKDNTPNDITIEYVPEKITIADLAPMYRQFYRVFEIFKLESKPQPLDKEKSNTDEADKNLKKSMDKSQLDLGDDEIDGENKDDKEKLSKRKLKKLTRLSVAELKQLVLRPDVVEMHDVTARDPKLLVQLKAYRNTVQVPRHWCFKRKYLQGKRGIEKPPFDLPAFIKKTGIMEMRESLQEKDEAKSLKSKMRERVRPKMGKIDIDYQKLHDAFFKWQTKPRMTIHGDLYYEGKEFETRLKEKKPGDLSEELRIALGMPVGPNAHKIPPPWLIAQQRYGPPPSYPNLKIPGLNAPIPEGCSFGYHAGGWGKPPVDESGKPLYGDVFGTNIIDIDNGIDEGDIERNQWGELESESEESSEEEEEDGEDMTNQPDESGLVTPAEGLVTPSGLSSVPAGMETPENIELRKKKIEQEMEDNETPVLYHVLPEKRTDRIGASMMASTHIYDVGGVKQTVARSAVTTDREGTVELALDPSELDMDNDAMAQRYEQQMREQQSHLQKEDLSDMLAEHVARQKSKRKRQTDPTKATKKYKEFKF